MIAVIDYGAGNLKSVVNALDAIEAPCEVVSDAARLGDASAIILPGVGAFGEGMAQLRRMGMDEALSRRVLEEGVPYLGICLGQQFLARVGCEHGRHDGFGWVEGEVRRIQPEGEGLRVPHIGWNELRLERESRLWDGLDEAPVVYFVHSYQLEPSGSDEEIVTSTAGHGQRIVASVERDNIFGVQFHPEKSQATGLRLLKNFLRLG
jgi:glutamine amidotransferase